MTVQYLVKRILIAFVSVFLVCSIVFVLVRLMPMEGYFENYDSLSAEQIENGMKKLGLDKPIWQQLQEFWQRLLQGDLGTSDRYRRNYPVVKLLAKKMPVSMRFGLASMLLSLPLGIVLGVLMSAYKGKPFGILGQGYIIVIQAVPAAIYYLIIQMHGSSLLALNILYREGQPLSAILPLISLSLPSIAGYAMYTERFMNEAHSENFVLAARAKGVKYWRVEFHHALRNAMLPVVQQVPTSIISTLSGSLYIESIYSIPGMGSLLVDAISIQDNSLVLGVVLVYTVLGIMGMLLGDILIAFVDPKIRFEKKIS